MLMLRCCSKFDIRVPSLFLNIRFHLKAVTHQIVTAEKVDDFVVLSRNYSLLRNAYDMTKLSFNLTGNKFCSSIQGQDVIEPDTELLDSASSLTNEAPTSKFSSSISKCTTGRTVWELEYIKDILCDVELMFNDYVLGRSHEVINPYLFNILENQNKGSEQRVRRKALFDCVCECLDLRCRQYVGGGYKMWGKGLGVLGRKEQLGKEIWKEISEWCGMGDCMVDELVDNDMSCWHGRWLDFEVDAFTIGVELESQILDSLVEEVLGDIAIP